MSDGSNEIPFEMGGLDADGLTSQWPTVTAEQVALLYLRDCETQFA